MSEITAYILVEANKTDPTYQRILVRKGEYLHPQFIGQWYELPEAWREKAEKALAAAAKATQEE